MLCSLDNLRMSLCLCKNIIEKFLGLSERFHKYINKNLDDINDELVYNALLGGLKSDGTFSSNSLAYFVRDFLGITIEDVSLVASQLSYGMKPHVPTRLINRELYDKAQLLRSVVEYASKKLGGCEYKESSSAEPSQIPQVIQDLLDKCILEFLPQYNKCVQLVFHTAQNTYRYLKALSSSGAFRGLLDDKELIDALGLTEILHMDASDFNLWGYPDCLIYDENTFIRCFDMKNIQTLGGALNRLALLSKRILVNMRDVWKKWFNVDVSEIEGNYVKLLLGDIDRKTQLANVVRNMVSYKWDARGRGDQCVRYISLTVYAAADLTMEPLGERPCITADEDIYFSRGAVAVTYVVDYNNIRFDRRYPSFSDKPLLLADFLARAEPLMFSRILNPIFIGDGKEIKRVFFTTSYPRLLW